MNTGLSSSTPKQDFFTAVWLQIHSKWFTSNRLNRIWLRKGESTWSPEGKEALSTRVSELNQPVLSRFHSKLDPSNTEGWETVYPHMATQTMKIWLTQAARHIRLWAEKLTCFFYFIADSLGRCECWQAFMGHGFQEVCLGLRKKKVSQTKSTNTFKYLLFIRCIAINQTNSLLIHLTNKNTEKRQFFLNHRLPYISRYLALC